MSRRYNPGAASRQYHRLPEAEKRVVASEVDRIYRQRTGELPTLDPAADMDGVRQWLRIRDEVMRQRLADRPSNRHSSTATIEPAPPSTGTPQPAPLGPDETQEQELEAALASGGRALPKRGLILAPKYNRENKADATAVFHDGMADFNRLYPSLVTLKFDNGKKDRGDDRERREEILAALRATPGPMDVVVYFGHAYSQGLSSAGFELAHLPELANTIRANSAADCLVLLYACRAAEPGGFAYRLAVALNNQQSPRRLVYSHVGDPGHSWWSPHYKRHDGLTREGEYVIPPTSPLFKGRWRRALKRTDLAFRFPFMTQGELLNELDPDN